jgi:hypothetical protein
MNAEEILRELRDAYDLCNEAADIIESLQAQLAKEKRRADRAVEDLSELASPYYGRDFQCEYCARNDNCTGENCDFEWRGDAEEGDGE